MTTAPHTTDWVSASKLTVGDRYLATTNLWSSRAAAEQFAAGAPKLILTISAINRPRRGRIEVTHTDGTSLTYSANRKHLTIIHESQEDNSMARTTKSAAPAAPATGVTAEDLMGESYSPGDLRTMVRTTKNPETKKLAQAELTRRATLAQEAARSKNTVSVSPEVAQAATAKVTAVTEQSKANETAVMTYLKDNPAASAPQTRDATGVSYSRVRKIAEANGHRFQAQDRTVARVLTDAEAKQLKAIEEKLGSPLSVLARALKAYDAS